MEPAKILSLNCVSEMQKYKNYFGFGTSDV